VFVMETGDFHERLWGCLIIELFTRVKHDTEMYLYI
jgi:hypothetical protein